MDKNLLIIIAIIFIALVVLCFKILKAIAKIKRMRSSGSNSYNNVFFYKAVKTIFLRDLPN